MELMLRLQNAVELVCSNHGDDEQTRTSAFQTVQQVIAHLDKGDLRVAEPSSANDWVVHLWIKKAIFMAISAPFAGARAGTGIYPWHDYFELKFRTWTAEDFRHGGFRVVPGAVVRRGAFVSKRVILMFCRYRRVYW